MTMLAAPTADALDARILVDVAVVLAVGLVLGRVAQRIGQPRVIGETFAGIVLGPSVLGQFHDLSGRLFPTDVRPLLTAVSQIGLVLFLFVVGWEFERRLMRAQLRLAAGVSLVSIALAFGLGAWAALLLYRHHQTVAGHHVPHTAFVVFIGAAMSVTAFPVLARILSDKGLTETRLGSLALASAAVDDVLAWCLLAYVSALVTADGDYGHLLRTVLYAVGYVVLMTLVVRPLAGRLVWRWVGQEQWGLLATVLAAGAFSSAWLTSWIGVHAFFGAFFFGFVMPREPARLLASRVREPLEAASAVLLPVFFIVTGLGVDLAGLTGADWAALPLVVGVACAGKLVGAFVPARVAGLGRRTAVDLALLMNTRGLTELIILNAAVGLGVLDQRMYTLMVVMALVTTAMAAPLLSRAGSSADVRPVPRADADLAAATTGPAS